MRNFNVVVNGQTYMVAIEPLSDTAAAAAPAPAAGSGDPITAPMPGTILDIKVQVGDAVKYGQVVMILEAMKMENEIVAPKDGTITSVAVTKGASVDTNQTVATIA